MNGCLTPKGAITMLLIFLFVPFAYAYLTLERQLRTFLIVRKRVLSVRCRSAP